MEDAKGAPWKDGQEMDLVTQIEVPGDSTREQKQSLRVTPDVWLGDSGPPWYFSASTYVHLPALPTEW